MDNLDELEALDLFERGTEQEARRAFDRLRALSERKVVAQAAKFVQGHDTVADVVQRVFINVWRSRGRFVNRGVKAWHGFLLTTATRCCLDLQESTGKNVVALDLCPEIPSRDLPLVEALARTKDVKDRFALADELWLGVEAGTSALVRRQQIVAAQLFYLDGLDWETALRVAGGGAAFGAALDRNTLDKWLAQPGVIRSLCYRELYFSSACLAGDLIGIPQQADYATLRELEQRAAACPPDALALNGWTWAEVSYILWRYWRTLAVSDIVERGFCRLNDAQREALVVKCASHLPFSYVMTSLLACRGFEPGSRNRGFLEEAGVWKRLVFEYRYAEDLAYEDMVERTAPAAGQVGITITETGTLKSWIGMGRLLGELAKHCTKRTGGENRV